MYFMSMYFMRNADHRSSLFLIHTFQGLGGNLRRIRAYISPIVKNSSSNVVSAGVYIVLRNE